MLIEFGGANAQFILVTALLARILSGTSGHAATPATTPEAAISGKWEGSSYEFQGEEFEIEGHQIKIGHCSVVAFSVIAVGTWRKSRTITIEIPHVPDVRKCRADGFGKIFVFSLNPNATLTDEVTGTDIGFYSSRRDLRLDKPAGASFFIRQNHPG